MVDKIKDTLFTSELVVVQSGQKLVTDDLPW